VIGHFSAFGDEDERVKSRDYSAPGVDEDPKEKRGKEVHWITSSIINDQLMVIGKC